MNELTSLEHAVLEKLLSGSDSTLNLLRAQLNVLKPSNRRMTGVGFIVDFDFEDSEPRIAGNLSFTLGDVHADMAGTSHGAGFLLKIRNGLLSSLEGFTYDDPWPISPEQFELKYISSANRDMAALKAKIDSSATSLQR